MTPNPTSDLIRDPQASMGVDDTWRYLSKHPVKPHLYSREPYFREPLRDLEETFGEGCLHVLQEVALAVLKPDGFVGRRTGDALDFIVGRNFTPIAARQVHYTYHVIRELWRFQWNAATLQKMLLSGWIHEGLPAVLILFRDDQPNPELPAAVRMKALKGHAEAAIRAEDTLRTVVRSPNRMMTIVHTADEPADLVRELGIFFDRSDRAALIEDLRSGYEGDITSSLVRTVAALERVAPYCDFDPQAALYRLARMMRPEERRAYFARATELRASDISEWQRFIDDGLAAGADKWDLVTVCTEAIEHQEQGYEPHISFSDAEIQAWRDDVSALARRPHGQSRP